MPDPGVGLQILNWAWDRKDAIAQSIANLYKWFRGNSGPDERGILIIGPGGTGKTTLARLLSGEYDWLRDSPWEYKQSLDTEHSRLKDDPTVELVAPPGQPFRREFAWPDLLSDLSAGKYRGVIFTVSYGYHSLTVTSHRDHVLFTGRKEEFLKAYTADRRADELRVLQQLASHLAACPRPIWLLVAVVKQDLWTGSQREVEGYYRGDFYREFDIVQRALGDRFRVEFVFGSLVVCNFETQQGERLASNEAGYDQRDQVQSIRHLFEVVAALKAWEEKS